MPPEDSPIASETQKPYDVFLCYNSEDEAVIWELYDRLKAQGLRPWIDKEDSVPGRVWYEDWQDVTGQVGSVAVFVGGSGFGPWQKQEVGAFLAEFVNRGLPVIPVLLENAPSKPKLPLFLGNFTWVDFKQSRPDPFDRLIRGITGKKPESKTRPTPTGLKPGAPDPRVRLPENYVDRPDATQAVKSLLLTEEKTVVVSAIAGLGGLGKSVLATAIVLDEGVRSRFEDGILWVTLGQNPDLLGLLGDWIRALDKSRESYAATTLEAASRYLQTLLAEKQMLLVVDDVWNGAHVEYFRVGGADCRVLVTTREAQIEGAEAFALDWMTEEEAIALVSKKLGRQWRSEMEPEMRAFARSLGYLPLALDLSANLVRDGLSWGELRSEFEAERRAVALEVLDATEAFQHLAESEQRKYSLRACFNLSLRRLTAEQLRQFAWLGVLPEDVRIDGRMAVTLWDLPQLRAKRLLIEFWRRSLLTRVEENGLGEPRYRVHDLMHDTARGLIEQGTLGEGIQNLSSAHGQLLERYRSQGSWYRLVNDGYIYRHLTWHLVQAGRGMELHDLLAMSDELGRNAWFEACDRIGEPGIFVQDVKRGWEVAEQLYEEDATRAIVLQCRYALVMGTLNSLVEQLSGKLMAAFVKGGFWTIEQAWAYVEQMQDEGKIAEAIQALAPYLTKVLFEVAVEKGRSIQNKYGRAQVLSALAKIDETYFFEALEAARSVQDEYWRVLVLSELAKIDTAYFSEALEAAQAIQNENSRAGALNDLVRIDAAYFSEALEAAQAIQNENSRARALSDLVRIDAYCFSEELNAEVAIQDEYIRANILNDLAQINADDFSALLAAARSIQSDYGRAFVLSQLAQIDETYFPEALAAARSIQSDFGRARVLTKLAQIDRDCLSEALAAARSIQSDNGRASVLSQLAQIDETYFPEALAAARSIQDDAHFEYLRALHLCKLAQIDRTYFFEALAAWRSIRTRRYSPNLLNRLAQMDGANFSQVLEVARLIQDDGSRAEVLSQLAQIDRAYFFEALEAARSIREDDSLAEILSQLVQNDGSCVSEALVKTARSIQSESSRASVLSQLAQIDRAYFPEALAAARSIQSESSRASVLSQLAQIDRAYFPEALVAARSIQEESWHSFVRIRSIRTGRTRKAGSPSGYLAS
jgi:hypothetical protein